MKLTLGSTKEEVESERTSLVFTVMKSANVAEGRLSIGIVTSGVDSAAIMQLRKDVSV